jgi:hypothetical protein
MLYKKNGDLDNARLAAWQRMCDGMGCKYLELAGEAGETGYLHGQGRIVFRRAYRRSQLRKLFPELHWEPTICKQDCLYLRKADSVTLLKYDGRVQGQRLVFSEQREAIQQGSSLRDCTLMDGANYQSLRSAEMLFAYFEPERPEAPRDVHLVPPTGAGMPPDVYRLRNVAFWDGYDAHKCIYVNQSLLKLTTPQLAQIIGPAPFRAGRTRQARFDTVYISGLPDKQRKALGIPLKAPERPVSFSSYIHNIINHK